MKQRYILFKRAGVFYSEDTTTRKQISLRPKDEGEAAILLNARNEAARHSEMNLQIAHLNDFLTHSLHILIRQAVNSWLLFFHEKI
jgi:hypothetical protein